MHVAETLVDEALGHHGAGRVVQVGAVNDGEAVARPGPVGLEVLLVNADRPNDLPVALVPGALAVGVEDGHRLARLEALPQVGGLDPQVFRTDLAGYDLPS